MHAIGLFVVLFGAWILLSGHFSVLLLASGAVCSGLTVALANRMNLLEKRTGITIAFWRLPIFWFWLGVQILLCSITVSRKILSPKIIIDPVIERIPTSQKSDIARVIYANSVTLTPGTLSTDLNRSEIEVHALEAKSIKELQSGGMETKIKGLERIAKEDQEGFK